MLLEWLSVGSRLLASFHGSGTRDVCTCGTAVELRSEAQVHVEPPGLWGPGYAQSWRQGLAALFQGAQQCLLGVTQQHLLVAAIAVGYLSVKRCQLSLQSRLLWAMPAYTAEPCAGKAAGILSWGLYEWQRLLGPLQSRSLGTSVAHTLWLILIASTLLLGSQPC